MEIDDISATDLATLNEAGYSEGDLAMLAETEVQALLGGTTKADDERDPHGDAAEDQERAAREAAESTAASGAAAAADASGNIATATETAGFVMPQLTAEVPADVADQIAARRTEQKAAFSALMDGTSDADAYQAVLDRTDAEIEKLREAALTASIFTKVNEQNAAQQAETEWARAQTQSFAAFKAEGLDYKDTARPGLLAAFNHHLKALAAVPANEKRDGAWFLTEAHKLTKADLGITATQTKSPGSPTRGVDPSELPPTLRSVPTAATSAVNTDEFAHMRTLDGVVLERAYASLSEAAMERWRNE